MTRPRPAPVPDEDDPRTPKATEAERLIVQFMVTHPACVPDVLGAGFVPEDCYSHDYREVARLVVDLHAREVAPYWHVVGAALKTSEVRLDDPLAFEGFDEGVPRPDLAGLAYFVGVLKDRGRRRRLLLATRKVRSALADPDVPLSEALAMFAEDSRLVTAPEADGDAGFIETLPDLLARRHAADPEPVWLVPHVVPRDSITLLHSQPRELKTLITFEVLLAVTTSTPAFGLEPLRGGPAVPAWYVTEEDAWHHGADRFAALLEGRGLSTAPALLHTSIGKGLDADDPEWQARIVAAVQRCGFALVAFDPLRSLTAAADQGPRELKPFVSFARRLMRETGCALLLVHHDTKPSETPDTRRRPQRASGGGIFSIADAPIHIESIGEGRRLLVPSAFKFCKDPSPITVTLEHGDGWLRLVGELGATTDSTAHAVLDAKILEYLKHSPYTYGSKVSTGVQANKGLVLDRLKVLAAAGAVDSVREARGVKWFLARPGAVA